ncbi:MAG: AAA family ATPase [Chloroflexi bacterium]|nr:AAA family ATPase [Chloroflexota bacterium]
MAEDLFTYSRKEQIQREAPLAARMRPRTLDEFVGQEKILGPGRLLRRAIETDQLSSLILWGPPGTGKTTLAMVIANHTKSHFETISAVMAGVADIRRLVEEAKKRRSLYGQRTIVLVDEIHRFNKAQQDALLPHVENGTIILVGATTENPYFEVISALVSRSRVFRLDPLTEDDLITIIKRALTDKERGYGRLKVHIDEDALSHWVNVAGGDARVALNALESAVETTPPDESGTIHIDLNIAQESVQRRAILYDKNGDAHYDTISAFIKSLRGSDPDAALYWMAKMIYAGEDPRFIVRRMIILASEDIGLADPQALVVATAAAQALEWVGLPEAQYALAEAAIYLATAPKSNSVGGYWKALEDVERLGAIEVPDHLKDASRDGKALGHGKGYKYPHGYPGHHVAQQYLPDRLQGRRYYEPGEQGYERVIRERLERWRKAMRGE